MAWTPPSPRGSLSKPQRTLEVPVLGFNVVTLGNGRMVRGGLRIRSDFQPSMLNLRFTGF